MTNHDTPAIRIASTRPGLWRCGVQHPGKPVEHPAGTFSPEQIERLRAEPALVVDVLTGGGGPAGNGTATVSEDGPSAALKRLTPDQIDAISRMSEEELDRALGIAENPARKKDGSENANRKASILAALRDLDPADGDNWTRSGKPQIHAIEAAIGLNDITAAERDDAWDSPGAEGKASTKAGHATTCT